MRASGPLTILRSTISNNSAVQGRVAGAGVHATNTVTIVDSLFTGNRAEGGAFSPGPAQLQIDSMGGGLAVDGATGSITGSRFEDNVATGVDGFGTSLGPGGGGGISAVDSTLTITDTVLHSNTVPGHQEPAMGCCPIVLSGVGGGLAATGSDVELVESEVTSNDVGRRGSGGGVWTSDSTVDIRDSRLSENDAANSGGGVATNAGSVTIERTTLSANVAFSGGGLSVASGGTEVVNSTLSGNLASAGVDGGGGISLGDGAAVEGPATIRASTVAGNRGIEGHDTAHSFIPAPGGATAHITGSIVQADAGLACAAPLTSGGYNLASDTTCGLTAVGDVQGVDALLGSLQDNGGPTPTHLPGAGSPARDAVPIGTAGLCDGTLTTDQRGVTRPQGPACDKGSVEQ